MCVLQVLVTLQWAFGIVGLDIVFLRPIVTTWIADASSQQVIMWATMAIIGADPGAKLRAIMMQLQRAHEQHISSHHAHWYLD